MEPNQNLSGAQFGNSSNANASMNGGSTGSMNGGGATINASIATPGSANTGMSTLTGSTGGAGA